MLILMTIAKYQIKPADFNHQT